MNILNSFFALGFLLTAGCSSGFAVGAPQTAQPQGKGSQAGFKLSKVWRVASADVVKKLGKPAHANDQHIQYKDKFGFKLLTLGLTDGKVNWCEAVVAKKPDAREVLRVLGLSSKGMPALKATQNGGGGLWYEYSSSFEMGGADLSAIKTKFKPDFQVAEVTVVRKNPDEAVLGIAKSIAPGSKVWLIMFSPSENDKP